MRANLSFGDQLEELSLRAQLELSRDQLELARVDTVTEAACTDYTCAVKIIPAWVGILILGSGQWPLANYITDIDVAPIGLIL